MKKARKIVSLLLVALVVATGSVACGKKEAKNDGKNSTKLEKKDEINVSQMKKMPNIEGTLFDGKKVDNAILQDSEYTLINVWSTSCGACIEELPALEKISKDYKSKGLKVVGIVAGGDLQKIEAYKILEKNKVNFDNIIPSEKFIIDFVSREDAVPYTLIVNKKGEIKKFILGSLPYEDFQKILNEEIKIAK